MSTTTAYRSTPAATRPMPSSHEVNELLTFLAANVDVSRLDGDPVKAERYAGLLETAKSLAEHARTGQAATR